MDNQKVRLRVTYPVVMFKTVYVDVTAAEAEDLCAHYIDRDKFIEKAIQDNNPEDLDWLPMSIGKAIDDDFETIKRVKEENNG